MKNYILTIVLFFCAISSSFAQFSTVASGFIKPAGIEIDDNGNVLVTETGTGANDARVVMVRPNGDKIPIITGLPSFTNARVSGTTGAVQTLRLANNRLAVLIGEGSTPLFGRIMLFNMTGFQAGVSPAKSVADTTSTIDVSRYVLTQTTASNPFSFALGKDGSWYVVDAGANMIVKITAAGQRSVFTAFPRFLNPNSTTGALIDAVPTKIINKPDGGFYVCTYTGFPFIAGKATIYSVDNAGVLTPYISNMTLLTDLQIDPRTGDLYALQYGVFANGYAANSAKVFRIANDGSTPTPVLVDGNFGPSVSIALDKNGTIYATALGAGLLLKKDNATRCTKLDLSMTADNNNLTLYSSIKYSLTVKNSDVVPAINVRVYWMPPYKRFEGDAKPFARQGSYQSKGRYDYWGGYWVIPRLEVGESATAYNHLFVVNNQLDATQIAQVANCNEQNPNYLPYFTDPNDPNFVAFKADLPKADAAFSVSPNPANEKINVAIKTVSDAEWTVKVLNTIGQTVFSEKGYNSRTVDIDSKNLQNGLYIVEYQSEGERKTGKVLIQH